MAVRSSALRQRLPFCPCRSARRIAARQRLGGLGRRQGWARQSTRGPAPHCPYHRVRTHDPADGRQRNSSPRDRGSRFVARMTAHRRHCKPFRRDLSPASRDLFTVEVRSRLPSSMTTPWSFASVAADQRPLARRRSYTASVSREQRSQVKSSARSRPRRTSSACSDVLDTTVSIARRISSADWESQNSAASPATSGRELVLPHTTGQPRRIASSNGIPNPSYSDGYTKTDASL